MGFLVSLNTQQLRKSNNSLFQAFLKDQHKVNVGIGKDEKKENWHIT